MASIFGFRSRNPARDRQTDISRLDRLAKLFEQIAAEIEAERNGLENRYKATAANAAFLVEAMENGSASARRSAEVDELTTSILNCERRIAALSRQNGMVRELRRSLDMVFDEDGSSDVTASQRLAKPAGAGRG
ncbi:hypothetical protein LB542_04850 [Mesorhizobium sp. BR1-1-9]|uniref:hypothetical protein n=1 Tax=unclassified Mesorhizobium TaxID=325217 RepID=UPI00112BF52C|nr:MULTISPECIES: hypothetical protein [unclassified Mesorhizobium]MBZ9809522.1 hypothetical protein [Mesorhizobium sp. ESP-6-2]MBZ9870192.1 hypothetical protein [Mesorhizobium sp. BR1-1-9]MBZ9943981.1 hypothetical protein [Mesorhizobium sp. BR1-1-13]TPM24147.1 hypothetical protein FJ955_27110 [Mesorhizobium sp. B2-2-2]